MTKACPYGRQSASADLEIARAEEELTLWQPYRRGHSASANDVFVLVPHSI